MTTIKIMYMEPILVVSSEYERKYFRLHAFPSKAKSFVTDVLRGLARESWPFKNVGALA